MVCSIRILVGRKLKAPRAVDWVVDSFTAAVFYRLGGELEEFEFTICTDAARLASPTPVRMLAEKVLVHDRVLAVVVESDAVTGVLVLQVKANSPKVSKGLKLACKAPCFSSLFSIQSICISVRCAEKIPSFFIDLPLCARDHTASEK